jgi:serpin B
MYLINAVYFKGMWTTAFDSSGTKDDYFNGVDGQTPCRMMGMEHELAYAETPSCQIVELPYGDGRFGMLVVLPSYDRSLDAFMETLTPAMLDGWPSALASTKIDLYLPKFTMRDYRTLNDALISLGMGVAFSGGADFSRINSEIPLMISRVLHKSYVSVEESGTEAAAATVVEIKETSAGGGGETIRIMRVDRPFLFFIRERSSSAVLFSGKVNRITE